MTVKNSVLDRVEFTLIGLFKIVLLTALCGALVASGVLAARGASSLRDSPSVAPVRGQPPSAVFEQRALLEVLSPPAVASSSSLPDSQKAVADPYSAMHEKQVNDLWEVVQPYQVACGAASPLTREQFVEGLRQSTLAAALRVRGSEYATSLLQFATQSLTNPSVVELCKSGKSGIFFAILEHHRTMWDQHQRELRAFNDAEREREDRFQRLEASRIADAQAEGYRQLTLAAAAFGAFMSLALVLIFARIETNLRGLKPAA